MAGLKNNYRHWTYEVDPEHIGWLSFDKAESSANTLNEAVLKEFNELLISLEKEKLTGLIIQSAKKNGFIAGADIEQFKKITDKKKIYDSVREVQTIFNRLESLPFPTVALIHGFCLGGGLELALACRYRVALNEPNTRIGLPEVKLGIHPGWGGSVRLPKLIGPLKAIELILTGRNLSAYSAQKMGVVDYCVPQREFKRAAVTMVLTQPKRHSAGILSTLLSLGCLRPLLALIFYKQLKSKVNSFHYPAPFSVIKNWRIAGAKGEKALELEAQSITELLLSPTAQQLIRVFFLQEKMKSVAKSFDVKIKHVHVVGAGTMGGDIAAWCVLQGLHVTLQDREPKFIAPAIKRAKILFEEKLKLSCLVKEAMDRLQPDLGGEGIKKADVVIEAIIEDLKAKQTLFQQVESQLKAGAIMATNTSSIELKAIAAALKNKGKLIGIHFFNPVSKMPLVEVVYDVNSDTNSLQKALAFVHQISRLPLPVKSSPGFLVNRVLVPYLMEAMECLEEGASVETIDKAAMDFGMPMGPVMLADTVGLDICLAVARNLTQALGGEVPMRLKKMVEAGNLGRKNNSGFYLYKKGKPIAANLRGHREIPKLTDRLILRMLNEAVACLREGIVTDEDLLDGGMIFGTGFAPFRGGPLTYARERGINHIIQTLAALAATYGNRFLPDEGWKMLKNNSEKRSHT